MTPLIALPPEPAVGVGADINEVKVFPQPEASPARWSSRAFVSGDVVSVGIDEPQEGIDFSIAQRLPHGGRGGFADSLDALDYLDR